MMPSPSLQETSCSTGPTDPIDKRTSGEAISNDFEELHYEKLLLRANTALEEIQTSSESMAYIAVKRNTVEILKALLAAGSDPNTLGGVFGTPLQKACAYANEGAVRTLLENGARYDVYGGYYGSSLNAACISGSFQCVNLLIIAGADVHRTDMVGKSALLTTIASRESKVESFDYLIRLGADPLQKDRRGCNGLHYAARAQKCDIIKKLLEYAINVNVIDLNGWSPLHWAAASTEDSTETLSLLLQCGCDKSIRDKWGRTALNLTTLFKRSQETIILEGSTQTNLGILEDERGSDREGLQLSRENNRRCDGCAIVSIL